MSSMECHQDGWALVLQADAEAAWLSQAGEEMVWGNLTAAWQHPWRNDGGSVYWFMMGRRQTKA